MMSPIEVDRNRAVALLGWQTADRLFGAIDPIDKMIKIAGLHFRVVGVSEKKGSFFGQSQDEFVVIPLGAVSEDVRLAAVAAADGQAAQRIARMRSGDGRGDASRCAIERRLKPREPDNFGIFTSDTILGHLSAGHHRHLRGAGRRRRAVAGRRRHRDHEHHADGGERADARDRPAQGARRASAATSCRRC